MKKKIMLIDDNPDLLYMVKRGLERLTNEYEIIGIDSSKKCLDSLKNHHIPNLILLDIMMPEINGWMLFAKIKENPKWRDIPIVFLTAKTDEYSEGFGMRSAQDYITKPFEIQELKERIEKVLRDKNG